MFDTITIRDILLSWLNNESIKNILLKDNEIALLLLIRIYQVGKIILYQNNILYKEETIYQI